MPTVDQLPLVTTPPVQDHSLCSCYGRCLRNLGQLLRQTRTAELPILRAHVKSPRRNLDRQQECLRLHIVHRSEQNCDHRAT